MKERKYLKPENLKFKVKKTDLGYQKKKVNGSNDSSIIQ